MRLVRKQIAIAKPVIGKEEIRAVKKVMLSGSLAQGPEVSKFENLFSKFVGDRECVAVNSGTSALHLAILSLGIGKGDEVLVPSFTFAASANAIALTGATPKFIDIDPDTFNLNPSLIEAAITNKTKAILVVHLYGLPADMTRILKIAKKYKLKIVEDAAQAHLATINGNPVGTFGDAAIFSFYPTKNMTSGEGGMIVTSRTDQARTCRLLRNQGMETRYQNEVIGFNLRMTDIHAAIGITQLGKVRKWTEARQENALYLNSQLDTEIVPNVPEGHTHVYHQYTIRIKNDRDKLAGHMQKLGVGSAVYYPTEVHKLPSFRSRLILPETLRATKEVLSIPVHPSLSKKDLKRISSSVNSFLKGN